MVDSGVDWGASGRVDTYSIELVDPFTLGVVGRVEATGGASSLTWALDSEAQLSATIDLAEGDYLQDGRHRMVRVVHGVRIGGYSRSHVMATMFVSNLSNASRFGVSRRRLSCYGPLYRYTQDVMAQDFVREAGTNCVENIRYIIEQGGGVLSIGDGVDTSRTHTKQVIIPVGYDKGEALRTYAGWIGCELMGGDYGDVQLRGYVEYSRRQPVYTFVEGERCVYLAGIDWETNRDEPINRVVAYFSRNSKQDDPSKDNYDPYPLADSCHVELAETADYSFERCGRWRTEVLKVTEPCGHDELVSQARRRLDERSASYYYIKFEHAGVPGIHIGDAVRYVNRRDFESALDVVGIVSQMSVKKLGPMCMTTTKILCVR